MKELVVWFKKKKASIAGSTPPAKRPIAQEISSFSHKKLSGSTPILRTQYSQHLGEKVSRPSVCKAGSRIHTVSLLQEMWVSLNASGPRGKLSMCQNIKGKEGENISFSITAMNNGKRDPMLRPVENCSLLTLSPDLLLPRYRGMCETTHCFFLLKIYLSLFYSQTHTPLLWQP